MIKLVIFDFDGTIADTELLTLAIVNKNHKALNSRHVSKSEISKLRGMDPRDVLKYVGISIFRLPSVARLVRQEMLKSLGKIKLKPGVKSLILSLKGKGYTVALVTSNKEPIVLPILRKNKLMVFDAKSIGSSDFGKARYLKKMIASQGASKSSAVYVGDEVRDIEAAHKAGIKIIAVTWGANSRKAFERNKADYIADTPGDVLKIVKG